MRLGKLETVLRNSGYVRCELHHTPAEPQVERVQSYLMETMEERRHSGEKDEKKDLLSGLITANDEFSDEGKQRLGDEELIGAEP